MPFISSIELIGFIVLIVFSVFWLVVPFIIIEKFNKVIKQLSALEEHLRLIRYNDEKARRESLIAKEIADFRSGER